MIIIVAIMSWLIAFNVINIYNNAVRAVYDGLNAVIGADAAADPQDRCRSPAACPRHTRR